MKRRQFFELLTLGSATALTVSGGKKTTQLLPQKPFPTAAMDPWIGVDLKAIIANYQRIKKRVGVKVMAVVKANAYGHGLVEVSRSLEKAGVDWLMVGKLDEAVKLRAEGLRCPILNFGPLSAGEAAEIVAQGVSQSVFTDEVFRLDEVAAKKGRQALVHVDIDTGMGRTGIPYDRALGFIEKIALRDHLRLEGISTTLTEDLEFDRVQLRRLNQVYSQAKKKGINCGLRHAASSAGLLFSADFYLDMVRPGITIYGYYPNVKTQQEDPLALQPAICLKARVIFIKDLRPGDTLSYHRVFKAEKEMRVATLGIGYSDGYQPELGGKSWVIIRGKKFKTLPLITANHLMIDLENNQEVKCGDEATLISSGKNSAATADLLAAASGISSYRLLIGLNPLLPRYYF